MHIKISLKNHSIASRDFLDVIQNEVIFFWHSLIFPQKRFLAFHCAEVLVDQTDIFHSQIMKRKKLPESMASDYLFSFHSLDTTRRIYYLLFYCMSPTLLHRHTAFPWTFYIDLLFMVLTKTARMYTII